MKIIKLAIVIVFIVNNLFAANYDKGYLLVYGQGPVGQHLAGDSAIDYTRDQAIDIAKDEISLYLSGMVYGYNFVYKVENKVNKRKGFFDITEAVIIKIRYNKAFSYRQMQSSSLYVKIQGKYRLHSQQKDYISGFVMTSVTSQGVSDEFDIFDWSNRNTAFYSSLKNAVLNHARKQVKSRPLYIKGKLILNEPPTFDVVSGKWRVLTKIGVKIDSIEYENSF